MFAVSRSVTADAGQRDYRSYRLPRTRIDRTFFESALGAPQSDRVRLRQRLNRARGQDDLAQCCSLKLVRPEPVEG